MICPIQVGNTLFLFEGIGWKPLEPTIQGNLLERFWKELPNLKPDNGTIAWNRPIPLLTGEAPTITFEPYRSRESYWKELPNQKRRRGRSDCSESSLSPPVELLKGNDKESSQTPNPAEKTIVWSFRSTEEGHSVLRIVPLASFHAPTVEWSATEQIEPRGIRWLAG